MKRRLGGIRYEDWDMSVNCSFLKYNKLERGKRSSMALIETEIGRKQQDTKPWISTLRHTNPTRPLQTCAPSLQLRLHQTLSMCEKAYDSYKQTTEASPKAGTEKTQ